MRLRLLSILTLLLGFLSLGIAPVKGQAANDGLHHVVRPPKIPSAHPPLLVLLHGIGSNEQDLFSFAEQLPGQYLVVSARAPLPYGGQGFAWYEVDFSGGKPVANIAQEASSRKVLIAFIEQMKERHGVPDGSVYLCGFSQGAIMSYNVALTRPDLVAGIAILGGRLMEEVKPVVASPEALRLLRVFVAHGTDDKVLPIQHARDAVAYLQTLALTPLYREYKEGHGINGQMLADLVAWLDGGK